MRDVVENVRPAWYPVQPAPNTRKKTPGQVQRGDLRLLVKLGTPAKATRVAGKGEGRAMTMEQAVEFALQEADQ